MGCFCHDIGGVVCLLSTASFTPSAIKAVNTIARKTYFMVKLEFAVAVGMPKDFH